ncbi:DMT family transporter [Anaerosacchariphilus polymeriproducens]|uniref:EamA family transporter n=1 Tax=Anaerosacchariphilus polymeriproducens TaxID=1812858 RepID=A0A371ASE8_9FIRM|nr:DMT family transporter [Anaerosacchariphilus polymeriproducens]RDU22493.1 EamA family transporter [Anaerosacchariphilus polymeriproducens]
MIQYSRFKGYIMALSGAALWGISGNVAQELFQNEGFRPGWLVTIRMLLAGVLLLLFASIKSKEKHKVWTIWSDRKERISLILFGIFGMLGVQYSYFMSINYGNAATATLLQYLAPIFIIVYLAIKIRKIPSKKEMIAVFLAILGTFFLVTNGTVDKLTISFSAIYWGLGSAIALAFYTIFPKSLLKRWGSFIVVGWGMIIGGIGLSFINPPWKIDGQNWSLITALYIGFVVIFGTLIAFYLYIDSLRYISPTEASLLGSAEPLSATIVTIIWMHVTLGSFEIIGGVCIIGTVLILTLGSNRENKKLN